MNILTHGVNKIDKGTNEMSKGSEAVKFWRRRCKSRIIESMGGKCVFCGYKKCDSALELHHINKEEKDFGFGAIRASIKSWNKIVKELRKCILICANCHRELHDELRSLPKNITRFDESFCEYRETKVIEMEPCPICGKDKPVYFITCSQSCSAKKAWKVDWDSIDLLKELESKSKSQIARELNITEASVRKRLKRISK